MYCDELWSTIQTYRRVSGYGSPRVDALQRLPPSSAPLPLHEERLYHEKWRPQFHFTSKQNWLNDPNGLVFFEGEYHLFFQHDPHGTKPRYLRNMTWGHAVSKDLLHWQQLDHALWPDRHGTIFSGSAVVDWQNTGGFQPSGSKDPCLVALYTSARKPRKFTQSLAHSSDRGRSWTKVPRVVPRMRGNNRDPKVFWHGPSEKWVMVLYLDDSDYALLGSSDLKSWQLLSQLSLPGDAECPDLFELSVDGDQQNTRWVFWGAAGTYLLGHFDGVHFHTETSEPLRAEWGGNGYAAQTYSDAPEGRCIQISWMRDGTYPGMPFNQQMSFPVELELRTVPGLGICLCRTPVKEIQRLHRKLHMLRDVTVHDADWLELPTNHNLLDVELKLPPYGPTITLSIMGHPLRISRPRGSLQEVGSDTGLIHCDNATHSLDGTPLTLPPTAAVQGSGARSILCWMCTHQSSDYCLVSTGLPKDGAAFNLVSYGSGGRFVGVMGYNHDFYPTDQAASVNDGAWHLVAATYSGSSSLKIYVDGVLMSAAQRCFCTAATGTQNFLGASNHVGFKRPFTGSLRGLQIYGRELGAAEVAAVFEGKPAQDIKACENPPPSPSGTVQFKSDIAPLACPAEGVSLRLLIDITSLEVFDMQGVASMLECFLPERDGGRLKIRADGGDATVDLLVVRELESVWSPVSNDDTT